MTDPTPDDDLATLRDFAGQEYLGEMPDGIYTRVADEIEQLQAALTELARCWGDGQCPTCDDVIAEAGIVVAHEDMGHTR